MIENVFVVVRPNHVWVLELYAPTPPHPLKDGRCRSNWKPWSFRRTRSQIRAVRRLSARLNPAYQFRIRRYEPTEDE